MDKMFIVFDSRKTGQQGKKNFFVAPYLAFHWKGEKKRNVLILSFYYRLCGCGRVGGLGYRSVAAASLHNGGGKSPRCVLNYLSRSFCAGPGR